MLVLEREEETAARQGTPAGRPSMNRLVSALMDRIECGVLACGPQGELHHANLAARRELQDARTLKIVDGQVRCVAAARQAWAEALHDAALRHRSRLVCLEEGAERLMVVAMPVHVEGFDSPVALVMVGRRHVCSALGLEMLASHHGLTFAEGRVFRALVGNHSPREIAASHGVAIATVRTQIQAVRDKLGVRSIDALLLRAAEVPPMAMQL